MSPAKPHEDESILDLEERTWLPRYCRGEETCFSKLMNAFRKPIYTYLVRKGLDRATCDDLFQEIFAKVHAAAAAYEPSRALKPWVFAIAVNTVKNHFRSHCGRCEPLDTALVEGASPTPERIVDQHETLSWLERAITELPAMQGEVLTLATIEGLRQQDVAEILQIPLNTVKTHLRRARQTLVRQMIERTGEANGTHA